MARPRSVARSLLRVVAALAATGTAAGCALDGTVGWDCPGVVINEFMTKNDHWMVDETEPGATPDWIELFNPHDHQVDLTGFRLVQGDHLDTGEQPVLVPPWESGPRMAPGSHLLVMADLLFGSEGLHLRFALSREASSLQLYGPLEQGLPECDRVDYPTQHIDTSYARHPDGGDRPSWRIGTPTPGDANGPGDP